MPRRWLRPISLLCLAAFLAANGPARFETIQYFGKDWVAKPCCQGIDTVAVDNSSDDSVGCCCCGSPAESIARHVLTPSTSMPRCPNCPNAPTGGCWRCAAKAPCSMPTPLTAAGPADGLVSRLIEGRLQVPLSPPLELLQPPRA